MGQDSKIKEFPDIGSKLTAPSKKSVFERQKAEAEAKRQREQEETAAVYEDFVKSFNHDDDKPPPAGLGNGFGGSVGSRGGGTLGLSKRHFSGAPAGRGGLGPRGSSGPGSLGPPPSSLSRKRAFDGAPAVQREPSSGLFAFEDLHNGPTDPKAAFQELDEEDVSGPGRPRERAPPKPTLRLSSLPPGMSPAAIKSFIPSNLNIDGVRILPPSGPGTMERRSLSAIVTLAKDTPALDIDTAVSALQNKYMGRGFYLTLSRHLSSTSLETDPPLLGLSSTSSSLPFGARPIPQGPVGGLGRGVGGPHRGGFAPPTSYASSNVGAGRGAPPVQVAVRPPSDIKQLKLIHKTLEALLTHGPDFEALLMSRRDVQQEEKWAWLWDSRSAGGVYYRYRLWDILTNASVRNRRVRGRLPLPPQLLFEGGAKWAPPELGLQFEYSTQLSEFVSDSDYNSSDDDDNSGDEGRRRYFQHHGGPPPPDASTANDTEGSSYLNPLRKAKLTHLLARLPTTNAKLRKGDVARVTAFAIQHAGAGAEEVVQMITSNVLTPYNLTSANPEYKPESEQPTGDDTPMPEKEDPSPSKLIALYLISDILSSSSTSGVRHAWRYRQLFESSLKTRHVFEHLGRLEKTLHWGRLRAEKWKRSVGSVLGLWEGWCVFPQASQEQFAGVFERPPLTKEEEEKVREEEKEKERGRGRWKAVDDAAKERSEVVQEPVEDVDGEAMDEDLDGEPMEEDLDGEPMIEDEDEVTKAGREGVPPSKIETEAITAPGIGFKIGGAGGEEAAAKEKTPPTRRRRPKAEDMFADSDGE